MGVLLIVEKRQDVPDNSNAENRSVPFGNSVSTVGVEQRSDSERIAVVGVIAVLESNRREAARLNFSDVVIGAIGHEDNRKGLARLSPRSDDGWVHGRCSDRVERGKRTDWKVSDEALEDAVLCGRSEDERAIGRDARDQNRFRIPSAGAEIDSVRTQRTWRVRASVTGVKVPMSAAWA